MASPDKSEPLKDFRTLLEEELTNQEEQLYNDIFGNRSYCDGAREMVRRLQSWLAKQA